MGSSHYQDEQQPSWFNTEFSRLASQIENMGREIEKMKQLYHITDWQAARARSQYTAQYSGPSCRPSRAPGRRQKTIVILTTA